ncbi:hypothetical protein TRV_01204 [Trichophyton verrucosum HKI 0517]|uniref:tRNA synthetases class I catalytic domain-containing protein n=1 Tax=Trichophyton verrucosum (strain HKI 0517) TaxID=663202 RepID=D4D2A1_TRIVH|nr:uncharacterized protein TRV_01204 [Trichophyton verrucosum HKI 0517]EFE44024.1 hypothetical protein TRV_01204 [Trichophyton verrucosum HKI 0517]
MAQLAFSTFLEQRLPLLAAEAIKNALDKISSKTSEPELSIEAMSTKSFIPSERLNSIETSYEACEDVFLVYLDFVGGSSISSSNYSLLRTLTRNFETRFLEDMRCLNVLDPDELTRVASYIPEIIQFIEKIIDNGFAYSTSDGSIYFNIDKFKTLSPGIDIITTFKGMEKAPYRKTRQQRLQKTTLLSGRHPGQGNQVGPALGEMVGLAGILSVLQWLRLNLEVKSIFILVGLILHSHIMIINFPRVRRTGMKPNGSITSSIWVISPFMAQKCLNPSKISRL